METVPCVATGPTLDCQTMWLMAGLFLPKELHHPWSCDTLHEIDYCQPLHLKNTTYNKSWQGFVLVFHKALRRLFVSTSPHGGLYICHEKQVQVSFANLPDVHWQVEYGSVLSKLELGPRDLFSTYDTDLHDIEVGIGGDAVLKRAYSRDVQRMLMASLPFKLRTYLFPANQRWYLCNVQGARPSCLVWSFDDKGFPNAEVFDLRLRLRDKSRFVFADAQWKLTQMSEHEHDLFATAVAQYALSGWKTYSHTALFAEETPVFTNFTYGLHNKSTLGLRLLQYIWKSQLPGAMRNAISNVQIQLLYSELVFARFQLVLEEFRRRKVDEKMYLTFHGVRCDDTEHVVKDICEFGFSTKHTKNTLHGGGGIYCTQQFGCALQWVKNSVGRGTNHVFVCLALPGNSRSNGKPGEAMQPNQHSWHAVTPEIWPYTYWVIQDQALLPIILLHLQ